MQSKRKQKQILRPLGAAFSAKYNSVWENERKNEKKVSEKRNQVHSKNDKRRQREYRWKRNK